MLNLFQTKFVLIAQNAFAFAVPLYRFLNGQLQNMQITVQNDSAIPERVNSAQPST